MKKFFSVLILLSLFAFGLFSQVIPESVYGIWEGKDRLVFFDNNIETGEPEISVYLKPFYGWYIDRTSEPNDYSVDNYRARNDATSPDVVQIILGFDQINKNNTYKDAFEIKLQYSKYQINSIPVAILDNKMYLNFYIQDSENPNLYRGNISSKGIKASEQNVPDNIGVYYLDEENNKYYNIRYWKTDMDYDDSLVLWQKGDLQFHVDKHLISAGYKYSSVSGRSKKIRNPVDGFNLSESNFIFSEEKTLLVADKQPYLYKLADHKTLDDLFLIVKEQNSKKKPASPPPFSYSEMEWHRIILQLLAEGDSSVLYKVTEWQLDKKVRESMVNGKDF